MRIRFLAALAAVVLGGSAQAAIVTYDFSGTAIVSNSPSTGGTFSGSFSYDTDIASYFSFYDAKVYRTQTEISFSSGAVNRYSGNGTSGYMGIENGEGGDRLQFYIGTLNIILTDNSGLVFNSTDIPFNLALSSFSSAQLAVSEGDGGLYFSGQITALVPSQGSAAPEPATWAMFIGGFGLIGAGMRRGRRSLLAA